MRTKWFALALLCAVQFMVVLDVAIVNVALPSIQADLGFSQENLQWVISAYALVFGGFMLLGGRLADILGRRGVFMAGLVIFSVGSLLCGLAWSDESLIAARALQGLGAATITPSALSILTTTFTEGRERNVALGAWGSGRCLRRRRGRPHGRGPHRPALVGVDLLRERPVGVLGLVLAPILLSESRDAHGQSHDIPGAFLVTSGLVLLVLGITAGPPVGMELGRDDRRLRGGRRPARGVRDLGAAAERASVPFSIFKLQTLTAANRPCSSWARRCSRCS